MRNKIKNFIGSLCLAFYSRYSILKVPGWCFRFLATPKSMSNGKRSIKLRSLLEAQVKNTPVKAIEIGTWFGEGSTEIIKCSLPPKSTLWLVDSWNNYLSDSDKSVSKYYRTMDRLPKVALANVLSQLYETDNEWDTEIVLCRGRSKVVLDSLQENSFQFIYIDGDHSYEATSFDIRHAKRLIDKKYGIICGDDLEMMPSEELVKESRIHLDRDSYNGYHPGVLLSVHENFEHVNMESGFWWVYSKDGEFVTTL